MARGWRSRSTADHPMPTAANRIKAPSTLLEKYSAFVCPQACSSSAGFAAIVSIHTAIRAAARFTSDSTASEKSPTDAVIA